MSVKKSGTKTLFMSVIMSAPETVISYWLDFIGSLIVAIYLIWCGLQTICEAVNITKLKGN